MMPNGATFVLVLLLIHCIKTEYAIDIASEICPFVSYCTVGPRVNFTASKDFAPCCSKCFCDEECWKYQDCCPDMANTHNDLDPKTSCVSSIVNSPALEGIPSNLNTYPLYRMFNTCLHDFNGSYEIFRKCEKDYTQEVPEFDDVVIVSNSRYHDEIYKNKYCAACHGVLDVVRWDLFISDCPGALAGDLSIEEVRSYIWNNCTLFSRPSAYLSFNRVFVDCGVSMESDCKDKRGFETTDVIKTMCETEHYAPVSVTIARQTLLFKNPYCALCFLDPPEISGVCSAEVWSISRSGEYKSMTALLDVRPSAQQYVKADQRCKNDEIFDFVMEHCRLLHCPWNSHMRLGECETSSEWVTNILVRVKLLFRPINNPYLEKEIDEYGANETVEFVADILRILKLGPCRPSLLETSAYLESNSQTLQYVIVDLLIPVSDTCTYKYVLQNQRRNAPLTFHKDISINNRSHPMDGNIYFAKNYDLYFHLDPSVFTQKHLNYYNYESHNVYTLEDFIICPYFSLNVTEYNSIVSHCNLSKPFTKVSSLKPTDRVHSGFYVLSDDTIIVCKDTYFRLCGVKNMAMSYGVSINVYFFVWFFAYNLP